MNHQHHYRVDVEWTGNLGTGTDGYRNYRRDYEIRIDDGQLPPAPWANVIANPAMKIRCPRYIGLRR